MNPEFDKFANSYRAEQTKYLGPTGENSLYFAQLKAQKLQEWVQKHLPYIPNKILDFGCGDGAMTLEVKKLFPNTSLYGVDPSSESIDLAKKTVPTGFFYTSGGTTLSFFESNMFDVIYCAGVFHHIPFNEHADYFKELYRLLRQGGLLVLFELNPLNLGTQFIFIGHPMETNAKMLTPWYAKKITQTMYRETIFYCFFPKFLRFLRPIEKWLTKLPFGGLYATIAQK